MTTNAQMLADRYGRRVSGSNGNSPIKRRFALAAFAAVAIVVFAVWAWFSITASTSAVSVVSSAAKPIDASTFEVSGKVARPAGGVVRCALQAQALDFAVVGYREIELAAGVDTFTAKVFSFAPAVSASVQRCWLQ